MSDRDELRHDVAIPANYRTGNGIVYNATVHDLSQQGCRVFDKFVNLRIGQQISIRIGSIGPLFAVVCWRDGTFFGLSFNDPLHPSVLDHMRSTQD